MSLLISFAWSYLTCEEREPIITKWKNVSTVGFETGTFRILSERAKRWAIGADKYRSPKGGRILPEFSINIYNVNYLYHKIDVTMICHEFFTYNIYCWCHSNSASVLLYFTFLSHLFPLPCGAGSTVPREGFDSSVIMPFSWCVVAVTLPI